MSALVTVRGEVSPIDCEHAVRRIALRSNGRWSVGRLESIATYERIELAQRAYKRTFANFGALYQNVTLRIT